MLSSFFSRRREPKNKQFESPFFCTPNRHSLSVLLLSLVMLPVYILATGRLGLNVIIILISICVLGFLTETIGARITKRSIKYYGISAWIIFPLLVPPGIPVWMILVCFFLSIVITQVLFGGFGKHIFNPAVAGQIFLLINFAKKYNNSFLKPFADPSFGFSVFSSQSFTNKSVLSILESDGSNVTLETFLGPNTGLISEMFPIAIIICGLIYLTFGETNFKTPLVFLISMVVFSFVGNLVLPQKIFAVLPAVLGGGTLFYAFFIFSDRWTSARTGGGRIISGIVAAFLTILIRTYSSNIEGIMFAAIFNYSFSPLYDELVMFIQRKKRGKYEKF